MHEKSAIHCEENVKQHRASAAVLDRTSLKSTRNRPQGGYTFPICKICQPRWNRPRTITNAWPGRCARSNCQSKWANYDEYLPMNIGRFCDFFSLGIW